MLDPRQPSFRALYGRCPDVVASAPGRVNLMGEHTDYNGGHVLPTPIPQRTVVELARRDDGRVRVWSGEKPGDPIEYELGREAPGRGWLDYVQGLTAALASLGVRVGGAELRISSDVPLGAGLSSSAALELAVLRALRVAYRLDLDDLTLAKLGQQAEHELVGAPVGLMDQLAASFGQERQLLLIDTRGPTLQRVPLPASIELCVIASGISHDLAAGDYATRRGECERAAAALGVTHLCELGADDTARIEGLPPPLDRRVRHVVSEDARVHATAAALQADDHAKLRALFADSHASMRDDYEVSIPAIDTLVELAAADPDVIGARLTGGGFGGSIVALARRGTGRAAALRIAAAYQDKTGKEPRVLLPEARS